MQKLWPCAIYTDLEHDWMAIKCKDTDGTVGTLSMNPFDSWTPQTPCDLEAMTPASASSGRRRTKLRLCDT